MRVLIYGGSFNPPHRGHEAALHSAVKAIRPDRIMVVPAGMPPHKELAGNSPDVSARLRLAKLAFLDEPGTEVLDIELTRLGKSYTVDTLREISDRFEDAQLYFLVGTDMLVSMEKWYRFDDILSECTIVALPRDEDDYPLLEETAQMLRRTYAARVILIRKNPLPMSSTDLRAALCDRQGRERLSDPVYGEIIRRRYYGAKPELDWLREKAYAYLKPTRVPHVRGTEEEAVRLAERWGEDPGNAAEAAILHDITKRLSAEEQLRLYEKYDIISDAAEMAEPRLYHARTGARLARDLFGVTDEVFSAIEWHTTGRPDMTVLEKIIYLADYTEPTRRVFPGLDEVRALTYIDLDRAMIRALTLSMEEVRARGDEPHPRSVETLRQLRNKTGPVTG
ncbi:MAG: nicotinate (nicotinamide) nucleotide adenylyltransferase [Oscillospiraceae bacterium]|nr:nicotinate (nicotinamide) nucleotide adenylyltransferase [Oscillospiraceae bacterium]